MLSSEKRSHKAHAQITVSAPEIINPKMEAKRRKVDYSDQVRMQDDICSIPLAAESNSLFNSLPLEIIFNICRFLDNRDKMSLRLISKSFYAALSDPSLWKEVIVTPNQCRNEKYVKNILKISQSRVHTLQLHGQIPFSSKYVHNVTSCNALRRLSLCGFIITDLAMTKIQTALPNLTHFEGQFKSFEKHLTKFSSLQYLVLHLNSKFTYPNDFFTIWENYNFRPPYVALVMDKSLVHLFQISECKFSLQCTVDHHAIASVYCLLKSRPTFIPFYQQPLYNYDSGISHLVTKVDCYDSPLIYIQQVVSPRLFECNTYICGSLKSSSNDNIPPVLYSEHGVNVTCLDFNNHRLPGIRFLEVLFSQTPNLVELNFSSTRFIDFDGKLVSINEVLYLLPIFCKRLQGLNIVHSSYVPDKEDLWNLLANISSLKYLATTPCAFLPHVKSSVIKDRSSKRISHVPVADYVIMSDQLKSMKQLTALQIQHMTSCAECESPLIQQSMLPMISNLACLLYLKLHIPKCFNRCSLGEVLHSCKVLEELCVITEGHSTTLVLPEDIGIYSKLKHLTILCYQMNISNGFFVSLVPEEGYNNKLIDLILIGNNIPLSHVFHLLTNCTQLLNCHIAFRKTNQRNYLHLFKESRKLAQKEGLTDFKIEHYEQMHYLFSHKMNFGAPERILW